MVEEYEGTHIYDEDPNEEICDVADQKIILSALQIQEVKNKGPLQYVGHWQGKEFNILIDGGSRLNLISHVLCAELNLQKKDQAHVHLSLPNGNFLTSPAYCPNVKMKWQDTEMELKAHVVELQDWHVILGVEWLKQLGEFRCNYLTQILQFDWKGEEVVLSPNSVVEFVGACAQLSEVVPRWMEQISESYLEDDEIQQIIAEITVDKSGSQEYHLRKGLLLYSGKWVIGKFGSLRKQVFDELHNQSIGGHSGQRATLKKVKEYFYWPMMGQTIGRWIRECAVRQQNKGEHVKSPGLLQPLKIPQEP